MMTNGRNKNYDVWPMFGKSAALCLLFALVGCGYTLNHRLKPVFLGEERRLFVPIFENSTYQTGAEIVFTNALIRELISRQHWKMTSKESAELELRGKLTEIRFTPSAFTSLGFEGLQDGYRRLPVEVTVEVVMELSLIRRKDDKNLWSKSFSSFQRLNTPISRTYDIDSPSSLGLLTQSIIESQYGFLARTIMRDVYDEMVEFF